MDPRPAVAAAAALCALLAGCSEAEDAARGAASDAASAAAAAAADRVRQEICARVPQGRLTPSEKQALGGLVQAGRAAGVSDRVLTPLDEIARSGDQPTAESVTALREACAATG